MQITRSPLGVITLLLGALLLPSCTTTHREPTHRKPTHRDTPELAFGRLRTHLEQHADAAVLDQLSSRARQSLREALRDPATAEHWRSNGLDPEQLRSLSLQRAFAQIVKQDRVRHPEHYRQITEGQTGRVKYNADRTRAELRCVHPESDRVLVLLYELEQDQWKLVELW